MPETLDWRPIIGYEGLYEVSSQGTVRRTGKAARTGRGRGGGARIGRHLTAHDVNGGYLSVQLWRDGEPRMHLVHRLVARAFLGPIPDDHEVNHRDGVKTNNALANLEYLTRPANLRHAYKMGLRTLTVPNTRRKPRIMVACACGCGVEFETPDAKGRDRSYVSGHNRRGVHV